MLADYAPKPPSLSKRSSIGRSLVVAFVSVVLLASGLGLVTLRDDLSARSVSSPVQPASVTTHYFWSGFNGNATIYPTQDTSPGYLPTESHMIYQVEGNSTCCDNGHGLNGIPNANILNVTNTTIYDAPRYFYEGPSNQNLRVLIWFTTSETSPQFVMFPNSCNLPGNAYLTDAVNLEVTPSGLPAGNTNSFTPANNSGVNISTGSGGTGVGLAGDLAVKGVSLALDAAGILFPEVEGIAWISLGWDMGTFFGPSGWETGNHTSNTNVGGDNTANEFLMVDNGTWTDHCIAPPTSNGQNVFSTGARLSEEFPLSGVTAGSLVISSYNELENGTSSGPKYYTGSNPSVSYAIKPAVSLGGYVYLSNTGSPGTPVPGATVTLSETSPVNTNQYVVRTDGTGHWRFFADPNAQYSVQSSLPTPNGAVTSSSVASGSLASDTGDVVTVTPATYLAAGFVTGLVEDGHGTPLPNAAVSLYDASGYSSVTSNASGDYIVGVSLSGSASNLYYLQYSAPSYGIDFTSTSQFQVAQSYTQNLQYALPTLPVATVGSAPDDPCYDPGNGYVYVPNFSTGTVSVLAGSTVYATVNVGTNPVTCAYDPLNGYIYVANKGSGNVTVINGATKAGTVAVGTQPIWEAYDAANGYVYVANSYSNSGNSPGTVTVLSGTSTVKTMDVGAAPLFVAYDSVHSYIFVGNSGSNNVTVLSGLNHKSDLGLGPGQYPYAMAFDSYSGVMYVDDSGPTGAGTWVSAIATSSLTVTNIPVGIDPMWVTYDPGTGNIYVPCYVSNNVSIINGTAAFANVSLGSGSSPMYSFHSTNLSNTPTGSDLVYVVDAGTAKLSILSRSQVIQTIRVGASPQSGLYDSGSDTAFVANLGAGNVSLIPALSHSLITSVSTQSAPKWQAYDPMNGYTYVADSASNVVTVIGGQNVVATLHVGSQPWSVAYDPADQDVYVVCLSSNNVTVFSGLTKVATLRVGTSPRFADYDPTHDWMYVPNSGSSNVTILSNLTKLTTVAVGSTPWSATYVAANGCMDVMNQGSNSVTQLCGRSSSGSVYVGTTPSFASYDAGNGYVYVTTQGSNNVTVLSASLGKVATVAVGSTPYSSLYDPDNGLIYVSDYGGSSVTIINSTTSIATLTTASSPFWAGFDPTTGDVYVSTSANVAVMAGLSSLGSVSLSGALDPVYNPETAGMMTIGSISSLPADALVL